MERLNLFFSLNNYFGSGLGFGLGVGLGFGLGAGLGVGLKVLPFMYLYLHDLNFLFSFSLVKYTVSNYHEKFYEDSLLKMSNFKSHEVG